MIFLSFLVALFIFPRRLFLFIVLPLLIMSSLFILCTFLLRTLLPHRIDLLTVLLANNLVWFVALRSLKNRKMILTRTWTHRRRLVMNIGGHKFGSQILGEQKFWGNLFWDKKSWNSSLLYSLQNFWRPFFSHRQLFYFFTKFTPFVQNVLRFLCIVVSVSAFFHVFFP